MRAFRDEIRAEMNEKTNGLYARMDRIQAEFGGLREAITGRKAA